MIPWAASYYQFIKLNELLKDYNTSYRMTHRIEIPQVRKKVCVIHVAKDPIPVTMKAKEDG